MAQKPGGKAALLLFAAAMVLLLAIAVRCSPPPDPVQCAYGNSNCIISNYLGVYTDRTTCRAARAVFPSTEEELVAAVAGAARAGSKMKATTQHCHSIPKLSCPDGESGVLISTKNLNRILSVNASALLLTVESGMLLRDFLEAAGEVGLALPHSPYWTGVTVGGMLGTGAHGSSLWGLGSAVHDYVAAIRIVSPGSPEEGYAVVRDVTGDDPDFDAVKVSLGVLGIISQVTFKMQPLFKRSITYEMRGDDDIAEAALSFGHQYEFGDINWLPGERQARYRKDNRAYSSQSGNGSYDYIGFRSMLTSTLAIGRSAEDTLEALGNAGGKCKAAKTANSALLLAAFGLTNDGKHFEGYPVVGLQHRIQAAGSCLNSANDELLTSCPWDPRVKGLFFFESAFSIGLPRVREFILQVQKLRELHPEAFCSLDLISGVLMRYVKKSSAYLGKEEDGVEFDFVYYRSQDSRKPRLYEGVFEEIEQMAMFKYGGLPHWGKNRDVAFHGVAGKYAGIQKFLQVKNKYDPAGLFSSEWTDQVLGIYGKSTMLVRDGCALEGLCICSEDAHCAPDTGYLCRPGEVYKEARVCRLVTKY